MRVLRCRCCARQRRSLPAGGARLADHRRLAASLGPALAPCCRHAQAALVCRRWRRLANAPQLLEVLEFRLDASEPSMAQPRVERICEWLLLRAGGHVQRLHLTIESGSSDDDADEQDDLREAEAAEALQEFLSALPALNSNRQLVDLSIDFHESHQPLAFPPSHSWAVAMRSLRRLHIMSDYSDVTLRPLHSLTKLEELSLDASQVELPAAASLPPSLQRLSWRARGRDLLKQVRALLGVCASACVFWEGD